MKSTIKSLEDLEAWRVCRALRNYVALEVVVQLPSEERLRLRDQMLRAARSSTVNITEGFGRFHFLDKAKFCSNARGSCWEVLDHLITAVDEDLLDPSYLLQGRVLVSQSVRLLNGYMRYLKRTPE